MEASGESCEQKPGEEATSPVDPLQEPDPGQTAPERLFRRANLERVLSRPDLLDLICGHVASGGTLIDLCRLWGARYNDVLRWIRSDPERNKIYSEAMTDRNEWVIEKILHELRKISASDLRLLFDENGKLRPPESWPDEVASAVMSIEVFEEYEGRGDGRTLAGYTKKIKLWDKLKAVELIGKNLKLFTDKVEHSIDKKLEDLIAESRK
jgi:hypothetical protein